jgi:hypothetical protein
MEHCPIIYSIIKIDSTKNLKANKEISTILIAMIVTEFFNLAPTCIILLLLKIYVTTALLIFFLHFEYL